MSETRGNAKPEREHWLVRPATIRWLWIAFALVLAATVALQTVVKIKGYFGPDGWFGFGAFFGFGCCVLMVLFARVLGLVLKRKENYYEDRVWATEDRDV